MPRNSLVVRTKLAPPRQQKRTLHRSRLTQRLLEARDYRLTVLQAGAGYGKSTALSALPETGVPLVWYHLDPGDADPQVFLFHLIYGFQMAFPNLGQAILAQMEAPDSNLGRLAWNEVVDRLVNELSDQVVRPTLLVLDDVHLLSEAAITQQILDRLISLAPVDLHTILSTRYPIKLPNLIQWRVKGEVLHITQDELAFTPDEIAELFRAHYGIHLSPLELQRLADGTEGWAIALQLYWQNLRKDAQARLPALDLTDNAQAEDLFAYLAQEVLARQDPELRAFLLQTAVLQDLSAALCDCLREASDSDQHIRCLVENCLFVIELGAGHVRFHPLFREFLLHQMPEAEKRAAFRRAGAAYLQMGEHEEAVIHLLAGRDSEGAAAVLDQIADLLVREGRLDLLESWLSALEPEVLERHPLLLVRLGDIGRLRSRFDEAFGWYRQAEERSRTYNDIRTLSQALHGLARVYLDTVNPSQAERILEEILRLTDGFEDRESRARLLELLAENRLNQGKPDEAERYQAQAQQIRDAGPSEAELSVRVLLRTGRLAEARRRLEEQVQAEQRDPVLRPRAHRETILVLSLILAFQGEGDRALEYARAGIERGKQLNSPFISAVGYMRQGHARLVQDDSESYIDASRSYLQAIHLGEALAVPRLKVEALWGLCRTYGFRGELEAAEDNARQGVELALRAGDEWIRALICVSMAGGLVLYRRYPAGLEWLNQAMTAFHNCNDPFGETATRLWQCLAWWELGDLARLDHSLVEALGLVCRNQYEVLFTRKSLLGPLDLRRLIPLLVYARDHTTSANEARYLLKTFGLAEVEAHPGFQLRVQTLGMFRVWRGEEEILPNEWRREKARQLFQLLLTFRKSSLDREQVTDLLWPELDPDASQRDFKVALSSLVKALEPAHNKDAASAFIARDGRLYGLRKAADVWIDADQFEQLVTEGDRAFAVYPERAVECYRQALACYQGEFLQGYVYEDWCSKERERLLAMYLRTADRLTRVLAEQQRWEDVVELGQAILQRDDCWEEAYRLMMIAYAHLDNRAQALRTWQRCSESIRRELGAEPAAETREIYQRILRTGDPV